MYVPRYGHTAAVFLGCGTNETHAEQVDRRKFRERGLLIFFQEILACLREKPASLLNMLDLPMEVQFKCCFNSLALHI